MSRLQLLEIMNELSPLYTHWAIIMVVPSRVVVKVLLDPLMLSSSIKSKFRVFPDKVFHIPGVPFYCTTLARLELTFEIYLLSSSKELCAITVFTDNPG